MLLPMIVNTYLFVYTDKRSEMKWEKNEFYICIQNVFIP